MTISLIIVGAIVLFLILKIRIVPDVKVKMADIPSIFEKLKATEKKANFAEIAFLPLGKTSMDDALNIQFSIEDRIGVDWVLMGEPNIQNKDKFAQFAGRLGHTITELEMNAVKYLRVQDGDLPKLCKAVISDLYAVPPDADLHLLPEGFSWP